MEFMKNKLTSDPNLADAALKSCYIKEEIRKYLIKNYEFLLYKGTINQFAIDILEERYKDELVSIDELLRDQSEQRGYKIEPIDLLYPETCSMAESYNDIQVNIKGYDYVFIDGAYYRQEFCCYN